MIKLLAKYRAAKAEIVEGEVAVRYRRPLLLIDALLAELIALETNGLTMTGDRIRSQISHIRAELTTAPQARVIEAAPAQRSEPVINL